MAGLGENQQGNECAVRNVGVERTLLLLERVLRESQREASRLTPQEETSRHRLSILHTPRHRASYNPQPPAMRHFRLDPGENLLHVLQ